MYQALKKAKIKAEYEPETFVLQEGFMCDIQCYERQSNGKGDMVNRGEKKILPIKYTPDFIGKGFIIETKGRANESFPMRWKMFKKYINKHDMPVGYFLWKQQHWIQNELIEDLEERFKRLEMIIIKLL